MHHLPGYDSQELKSEMANLVKGKSSLDLYNGYNATKQMKRCITDAEAVGHFKIIDTNGGLCQCTHCLYDIKTLDTGYTCVHLVMKHMKK